MFDNDNVARNSLLQISRVELTARLVTAFVSSNRLQPSELGLLIARVHATLGDLEKARGSTEAFHEKMTPAQIRRSITPDALISFIDGKPYKTLKRHLTKHGLDMAGYRQRYGLPVDYPATAASYSAARSALARTLVSTRRREASQPVLTGSEAEPADEPAA